MFPSGTGTPVDMGASPLECYMISHEGFPGGDGVGREATPPHADTRPRSPSDDDAAALSEGSHARFEDQPTTPPETSAVCREHSTEKQRKGQKGDFALLPTAISEGEVEPDR